MAVTPSTMLEIGTFAPDFALVDIQGRIIRRDDVRDKNGILILFICNHCPFVKHINAALVRFAQDYMPRGLGMAAISSNDAQKYPDDGPDKMAQISRQFGYPFVYLYDETQQIAQAYRAACTPDFFLFDAQLKLVYRGQFDASRPGNSIPVTGNDLRTAADALIAGRPISSAQKPSIGCNIKWRPGNEPEYFASKSV